MPAPTQTTGAGHACISRLFTGDQREQAGVQSKQAEEQAEKRLHDPVQPLATDSKPGSRAV
jgi:hypothetical protein